MFNRVKINPGMVDISSKASLKLSCLAACGNDVDKAKKLYDYMIEGMTDIPDFPVPKPNAIQQVTQSIESVFGWVDQNSDKIMKGYNFVQMMRGNPGINIAAQGAEAAAEIPPLPPLE